MDIKLRWTVTDPADEEFTWSKARPNSAFLSGRISGQKVCYELNALQEVFSKNRKVIGCTSLLGMSRNYLMRLMRSSPSASSR